MTPTYKVPWGRLAEQIDVEHRAPGEVGPGFRRDDKSLLTPYSAAQASSWSPQPVMVEVAADQHEPVADGSEPRGFVQGEPLADQMKQVSLVAAFDPQHAFGAEDVGRQPFEKALEFSAANGRSISNETASNPSSAKCARSQSACRIAEIPVRLKQPDAEDQRQRRPAARRFGGSAPLL